MRLLLRQFSSPMMLLLVVATLISFAVDDRVTSSIILCIIAASGGLGYAQERRARVLMERLLARVRLRVRILRGEHETEIEVEALVVGDIVVLEAGDVIPADLRLLHSHNLLVDESTITGESLPVEKSVGALEAAGDVFYGTHVVSGQGTGEVVAIGANTRFGALVAELEQRDVTTRFEREMTKFGGLLTKVMLVLTLAILAVNAFMDRPLVESLLFALALAVGIAPELLPAISMVSLAAGARQMATADVLVKRLDAIEDIGAMTMLCCDKTGTLTRGVVELDRAIDLAGRPSERVLELAAMNAGLQHDYPNALDQAIARAAQPPADVACIDEVPYDFERRRLSVLVTGGTLIMKGAVDSVLSCCTTANIDGRDVPIDDVRSAIQATYIELGRQGFRVLAVATRDLAAATSVSVGDERDMRCEGLLALLDPPTEDARQAVQRLRDLHIGLSLITGDNIHVATAVAAAVGLDVTHVIGGEEITRLGDVELAEAAQSVRVFAAVDPLQKERLVQAFRTNGHTVGFLGDGINDAAALRIADVGIAVEAGAAVAKQAAALVILSRSLDVIAQGVILGRRTFANTLKYIRVTISANFGNTVSMVIAAALMPFLPLLPVQILTLNFLSDGPALAIAADRVDPEQERQPGEWSIEGIRDFMVIFGLVSSVFDITAFIALRTLLHADAGDVRTAWFVLSMLTECIALLVLRTQRPAWRSRPARLLLWLSVLVVLITIGLPLSPAASALQLRPPGADAWLLIVVLCAVYALANEGAKRVWRRRTSVRVR